MSVLTQLLDANVLISLLVPEHSQHRAASAWFDGSPAVATCPTVQGSLLRYVVRQGADVRYGLRALRTLTDQPRHEQWLDDLTYAEVDLSRVLGHRQVRDAYLAALARARGGRVVTFDRGFAAAAPDVVDLLG
jgi:hypothetical protein